jgi:hypothetical protein
VKTYPIPKIKEMCIIECHYVFALHDAEEERQGASLLQPGGKPARGRRPGGAAAARARWKKAKAAGKNAL